MVVRGFGRISHDRRDPPDASSLFQIGSITMVFTALLLADMAAEGLVGLDDDLAAYMPTDVVIPLKDDRRIRLVDLAAHTAGLPRMPGKVAASALSRQRRNDPYAQITVDDLHGALSSARLKTTPGTRFSSSTIGAALLGDALARRAGADYETLVRRRIAEPLKLADTCITLTDDQQERLARGRPRGARTREPWRLDSFAPAGGLYSCVADMLVFLRANLTPPDSALGRAIQTTHAPRAAVGRHHQVGLGWLISVQPRSLHLILWHNGGAGDYRSFAGFVPKAGVGVVAVGAQARSVDGLCLKLIEHLTTRPRLGH